jgi:thiol:disulfide interchange protein/DsbC/DsbD-like thiol-disulfide interchange protein
MHRCRTVAALCALAVTAPVAVVAQTRPPKVDAALVADVDAVQPGVPFRVGLRQRIAPQWHTYWKNPGDSGEPTRITWTLPPGFAASDIRWPIPNAIPIGPLMNFGYSDDLLLPVTITPPATLDSGSVHLTAHATWLVCEKICVPEEAELSLTFSVRPHGAPAAPSANAELFAHVERSIPAAADWPATFARARDCITLNVAAPQLNSKEISSVAFFPDAWGPVDHAAPQKLTWTDGGLQLALKPGELAASDLKSLRGVLVLSGRSGGEDVRRGFAIEAGPTPADASVAAIAGSAPTPTHDGPARSDTMPSVAMWQAMLFALLGGLILNLMPCVLPILSLKALTLAKHGGSDGSEARRSGLAYFAGVLASFAGLAAVLIALRSAGLAFGWGFQFQSPVFVLAMAALFLALALSLSGGFDIGTSAVSLGEGLTQKGGNAGSFFTGVMATLAATPCTAPFMGAAVGYALTRPALELVLVMLAMGLGFAVPVLAVSLSPAVRALLPRPGPWMQTLKQVLAFPLYATVAWLVWVLSLQTGSDGVLSAGVTLIAVGFAAWLAGSGGGRLRGAVGLAVVGGALALTIPWLEGAEAPQSEARTAVAASEPFSEARLAELRAAGRPVFVNLTAAWCITCKVNERVALSSKSFRKALADHNIAYLRGDWTSQDEGVTRVLNSYGRAGVPLYLLYPADPSKDAIVLPQLLTEAIVVRHFAALDRSQAATR